MAEQQIPLNQEELNQQEFKPNVAEIIGYDKDMFNKSELGEPTGINPFKQIELFDETGIDWKKKNAIGSLNAITETTQQKVAIDADGDYDFSSNLDNSVGIMMGQEFDDPELEQRRIGLIDGINTKKKEEIEKFNLEVDNRVAAGELKERRGKRLKERNEKAINDKYKKESHDGYLELYYEGKKGKDKIPRKFRKQLEKYIKEYDAWMTYTKSLGAGNPASQQDLINSSSDPAFQQNYLDVKARGVSNINQFISEYGKGGNVKTGDVFLAYMTGGYHTDEPFAKSSRPVYFQATLDQNGNKVVRPYKPAFVHPVTGEIIGAYIPPRPNQEFMVQPDYALISGYKQMVEALDNDVANGVIDLATANAKKEKWKIDREDAVKKNIEAYNRIMSSDKFPDYVKLAVAASVFPNQFEEKYEEAMSSGGNVAGSILEYTIGLPGKILTTLTGAVATGIDEFIKLYLGNEDVEFPMGTLALELEKNPELASEMGRLIEKSGRRSSTYLSSMHGLAELTNAAKVNVKNKNISSALAMGQGFINEFNSIITGINEEKTKLDLKTKNFTNGYLDIFNKSGYTTALNNAYKLNSELINSEDVDVRNAYKLLQLKQKMLNFEGTPEQALATLSKEDVEFLNTTGADLTKNKIDLVYSVLEKVNKVAEAFELAKKAYPSKEIKRYDRKNKGSIEKDISDFNEKVAYLTNSDIFSSETATSLDVMQSLKEQLDQDAAGNDSYTFPLLSRVGQQLPGNTFAMTNAGVAFSLEILGGISKILRSAESTFDIVNNFQSLDYDLQKNYVSASLFEYKRLLETQPPDTDDYVIKLSRQIGGALPQMAAFVGSFVAGGFLGGAAYLSVTMTGDKMREGAEAGLDPIEQMLYAGLSIGIEFGSELITSETGLIGLRGGKSLLTKSILRRIMNVKTRKEALKEYARIVWNTSKNLVKRGALESFEEQVADKANFILQNLYNNVLATTFKPSVMDLQGSLDNLITMTATGGLFKGATTALSSRKKPVGGMLKKELEKQGINTDDAMLIAGVSSVNGLKIAIDFVNGIESGDIASNGINREKYEMLKNQLIPAAMKLQSEIFTMSSNRNISVQQRAVALFSLMQMTEIQEKVESGEVAEGSAEAVVNQLQENADKALKDKAFADEQFGLDDTGLAQTIKDYMGVSDIAINEEGAMDATPIVTTQEGAVVTEGAPAIEVVSDKPALESKAAEAESDAIAATSSNTTTSVNPSIIQQQSDEAVVGQAVSETETTQAPANQISPYAVVASEYLFNTGENAISSTDYFIQALSYAFVNAGPRIEQIRQKYISQVGDLGFIKDAVNQEFYKNMIEEIRGVINESYGNNAEIQDIYNKILAKPSGLPSRDGNPISLRLETLSEELAAQPATVELATEQQTTQQKPEASTQTQGFEIITRTNLAQRLIDLVAAPIRKRSVRGYKEKAINKNPEKAILMEIYSTRAQLEIAKDNYERELTIHPTAPVELANIRQLTDRLNKLTALKDNYFQTQQYATEISQGLQQEVAERRNSLQYQGTQEGQLEEGERERRARQDAQSAANYRNSNFSSQAQQATQEIAAVAERPPILNTYLSGMQPGQEVQLMDEIAAQVLTNEAAAVRQFGQPIVDRVKQYITDTNFTTELPVVREAMIREAEQRVVQAEQEASAVIERQNQNTSKQHKKAVVKLVERLKQAFPNVKVFMDKKGFEAAIQDPAARDLMTKGGIVYGRILNGDVYLNPDFSNYNTPIHEFGHLWLNVAKEMSQDAYNRGIELIRDSEYVTRLEGDPLYNGLTKEELEEEALATAIGDRGEQLVFESQRKGFRGWMTRLLRKMAQFVGIMNMSSSELRSLDLDTYLNMVNASLLAGQPLTIDRMDVTERFMAKMDNGVKNALTRVAQERFNAAIAKGMDLEAARTEAFTKVTEFVIGNYLNKSNYAEILDGLADIVMNVSEAERQRIIEQKKTDKLNQLFNFAEFKDIATMANEQALKLAQGKVKASDAISQVTDKVKAEVEALFAGNKAPAGVSWINAMALAPSIAADAVMAAFPATNRSSLVNEDIVTMTSSKFIRNAIFNQIKAIKDVEKRSEAIKEAVKGIFKQMSDAYGKGLQLSPQKVNAIIAEIDANVFSREDIMSATEEAANAVSNIIEKEYRKKLIDESVALLEKLKTKTSKAKYTGPLLNKATSLLEINAKDWGNSNATLEDISQFNTAVNNVLAGRVEDLDAQLDFAITKAGDIQIDNSNKIKSEFDSLIGKMNRMISKAGNLDLSDYGSIIAFNNAINDVKERKGALAAFTPEQLTRIEQKYSELIASIPGSLTIDEILAQKETEITNGVKNKAELLASELESETSDIRMRVKNPLMYHRIILFSKFILKGDYIDSLDIKGKLALINAIENVMMYGNPNHDVYIQDIKARKYYFKTNTIGWAMNMAKRRRSLAAPGLTGLIANKFKNFARVFTDVEGITPSAQLIADNFDLLRLHSMDVELFGGYDIFDMGFLERDIFAPMASGVDGAVNRTQAKLENLQAAMLLLGDKENRKVINKALKGLREQYGLGSNLNIRRFFAMFKRGSNENMYVDISTRMTSIISHQIDHISNLKEGQEMDDMILKRNILDGIAEDKKDGMTMFDRYGKLGSLSTLTGKYDDFLDAIAYSALTNNGTETLAGLTQEQLLNKLTPSQRKAINAWREFINGNKDLVESAMIIRGNMKALIKNYFPRMLSSSQDVSSISDSESYMNSQFENVGLRDGQISSRIADVGKISLNGSKVLLNNLKALHLLNEMQPYIDQIKAVGEAVEELKTLATKATNEEQKREYNFAAAYAEGISITIKNRLDNSLLNGDKAVNDNFNVLFRVISKTQKFAANMWLISTMRQLGADYPANIVKSAAAMAYANKTVKSQIFRLFSPFKSSIRTEKGKFVWEDYVKIAELTGSPVYRTVSIYSDNFLYDYSKTPQQLQRKQRIMSWQDMAVKKQVWMERFENAFTKITGEVFDHKKFEDERGAYRAMVLEAVEMASKAADSTVDRQFGLPSFARQPLKANILLPFAGRPLRNFLQSFPNIWKSIFTTTVSKTSQVSVILGFMMGYPSVQFSLFRNYMKLAFSGSSGLSVKQRAKYMSQALTEAYIPTFIYGLSRTFFGALFTTAAAAIYSAGDDEDEQEKLFKEMESQGWWERSLTKFKMEMKKSEEALFNNLINSLSSNVIDPQSTYLLRTIGGILAFQLWKKQAILAMDTREVEYQYDFNGQTLTNTRKMTKEERTAMGREIKKKEGRLWGMFNLRPIEIYGGQEYADAVRKYDIGWAAGSQTKGWEELFESIGGFGEVSKTINSLYSTYDLWNALDKNQELREGELLAASIMKGYALIFANFMLSGRYGWVASMLSGDANKFSNSIIKDLESQNKRYEKEQKEQAKQQKGESSPARRVLGGGKGQKRMMRRR